MSTIGELAKICRSKNAGPFQLTIDFLFDEEKDYFSIKESTTLTREKIAKLYKVEPQQVEIFYWDVVKAVKVTIPRIHSCGSRYDTDVFGAQQHMPLMTIELTD